MRHDPTEQLQEEIHHKATHGTEHIAKADTHAASGHSSAPWISMAAVTAAFLAALAAVTGALATKHLTESTHNRLESNDNWSYYQAKSLKGHLIETKDELLTALGHTPPKEDRDKKRAYDQDGVKLKADAEVLQVASRFHLRSHETYELAATMFHISIALVAVAVVAKRRSFWYLSIAMGAVGIYFAVSAASRRLAHEAKPNPEPQVTMSTHSGQATAPNEPK